MKESEGQSFLLETALNVFDLKENVTVRLEISNTVGSTETSFVIRLPPTTTTTTTTTTRTTTSTVVTTTTTDVVYPMPIVGGEKEEVTAMTVPAVIALVVGLGLGLLLICLAVFLFNKRTGSAPAESRANNSNRSSVYFPLEPVKVSSGYFAAENSSSFNLEPVVMRQNSGRKVKQMTTFGKGQSGQSDIENSIKKYLDSVHYEASPIIVTQQGQSLLSPDISVCLENLIFPAALQTNSNSFSDDTDDLSTLGVPVGHKDDLDPLSAWNDLEPELENRRSRNFDEFDGRQKR